jgi:DNA modification methylase
MSAQEGRNSMGGGLKAIDLSDRKPSGRWPANVVIDTDVKQEMGEVSRYYYCAKASPSERDAGLPKSTNKHPTLKPISLMRYLVRLVTPPGGRVLDPFAGSGTTGCAAALEGFDSILIELQKEYIPIIKARVAHWESRA